MKPSFRTPEDQDEHKPLEDIKRGRQTLVDNRGEELPSISVSWSLNPIIHSYSNELAPTLRLALISHADRPLTIYNDSLNSSYLLAEGKFFIFDLTSNLEIQQRKTRVCIFEPPSKVQVPLQDTLYPEVPLGLETRFGGGKHAPKAQRKPESAFDFNYPRMKSRGVDGLEVGHHYRLGPGQGWGYIRWWEYGERRR